MKRLDDRLTVYSRARLANQSMLYHLIDRVRLQLRDSTRRLEGWVKTLSDNLDEWS